MWGELLERSSPHTPFKNFQKLFYLKVLGILKPAEQSEENFKKGLSRVQGQSPCIKKKSLPFKNFQITILFESSWDS